MTRFQSLCMVGLLLSAVSAVPARAGLISVSGPDSSRGVAPSIIAAPTHALDAMVTNLAQQGFNERQGVLLGAALLVDGGSIAAGLVVDSHMIFLNSPNTGITHHDVVWTFSGTILGVMSDSTGAREFASTPFLGSPTTVYPGSTFANRGMEGADGYTISGNQLTVDMNVAQPGDWIRVVTVSSIPEPSTFILVTLGGLGLVGSAWRRRSRKSKDVQ